MWPASSSVHVREDRYPGRAILGGIAPRDAGRREGRDWIVGVDAGGCAPTSTLPAPATSLPPTFLRVAKACPWSFSIKSQTLSRSPLSSMIPNQIHFFGVG